MNTPLDIVDQDLQAVRAGLKAAYGWLTTHPHYGMPTESDGEMLCDIGTILLDSARRIDSVYDKLDNYEAEAAA